MSKKPARLYKQPEPMVLDVKLVIMGIILFALIFMILGVAFRHYPSINGVI